MAGKMIFAYGCYDLLHGGNLRFLQWASSMGKLVIGIPSDEYARLNRGRPLIDHFQRAENLLSLEMVSDVYIYEEPLPRKLVTFLKPDIIALGSCQHDEWDKWQTATSPDFRLPHTGEILSNYVLRGK